MPHQQPDTRDQGVATELVPDWLLTHEYALLNPLIVEPEAWADLPCEPLVTPHANVRPHLLPQLIRLNELSSEARLALVERIGRHQRRGVTFFCALLQSDASADVIAQHLKLHLEQRRTGDKRRWWLRFYDPHVFRHLCWQLEPEQMDRLLGPIAAWRWPDAQGDWHCQSHHSTKQYAMPQLMLDRKQWRRIDRLASLNAVLDTLLISAPEKAQEKALWQWVDILLSRAEKLPLNQAEDRQLYAEQAVRFHPEIHSHPALKARLEDAREQGSSYSNSCADLDDAMLESMATELNSHNTRKEGL
ncbi:DUF4123 domain-containing protein [Halomonas huangheensis]|uniref:DUF4123 domain-containing protein n=1 Tax=Halomonas huangheensis TaxID=1178482 RepID=UPI0009DBB82D|nr:DUF4123 domain-containing protein [Halomonas huangheensis]